MSPLSKIMEGSVKLRKERLTQLYSDMEVSFQNHQILMRSDRRLLERFRKPQQITSYIVGRPGTNVFRFEVYVGYGITVQGDINLMSFVGGPQDHRQKIGWLANSHGDYITEKALRGTGVNAMVYDHSELLAHYDVLSERRERNISKEQAAAAMQVLRLDGGVEQAEYAIQEIEYAECSYIGRTMSQRVVTAHAAVKCLDRLLRV